MSIAPPEGLLLLDASLLKTPLDNLQRSFRNTRKTIEKELTLPAPNIPQLIQRLTQSYHVDRIILQNLSDRVAHLQTNQTPEFAKTRNNRLLIEYLLRNEHTEAANMMIYRYGLESLVDTELYTNAQKITSTLELNKNCSSALQWCNENRSALKKINSYLEFELRMQEYILLVVKKSFKEAISYAKKHFVSFQSTHDKQIREAMGLLAFDQNVSIEPYANLYSDERWRTLKMMFLRALYSVNALPETAPLNLSLSAGLTALKTRHCETNCILNCPVCYDPLNKVSENLPFAHHLNSVIVDRLEGGVLDELNPVMVLGNGNCYGYKGLSAMAEKDGGWVTDPSTNERFRMEDLKKAFIL